MWLRLCGPYLIAEIIGIIFGYANIDIKCWYIPRLLENQPSQRWAACDDWIYGDKLAKSETTPETRSLLTRFGQSLHPRGMTTGAPPQYRNTGRFRAPTASCRLPLASLSLCRHSYNNNPPLIFMRRSGLQSLTRTLPYTTKYNSSPIVTGLVQIFDTYSTWWGYFASSMIVLCAYLFTCSYMY